MNKSIVSIIVVVLLVGGIYAITTKDSPSTPAESLPETSTTTQSTSPEAVSVKYTADGFSPKTLTIKKGQSVTWTNETGNPLWVASDPHPQHTDYDGTARTEHCDNTNPDAFDACSPTNSFTFTFNKEGTWKYHNHAASSNIGEIIVTE
jgi:plastocyanin